MPVCADPDDSVPFSLKTDEAIALDNRPLFYLRFLTEREARKVRRLIQQARDEPDDEKADALLSEAIGIGLVRHERMAFRGKQVEQAAAPSSFLSTGELWELSYATLSKPAMTEAERQGSVSSPGATQGPTAAPAGGESA